MSQTPPPSPSPPISPEGPAGCSLPAAYPRRNPPTVDLSSALDAESRCHANASTGLPCAPMAAMHHGSLLSGGNEGCRWMHSEQISRRGARVEPLKDHLHEPWHGLSQRSLAETVVERGFPGPTQPFLQAAKRSNNSSRLALRHPSLPVPRSV
jgi:hypothetical protein